MTRREFDDIEWFGELQEACQENGLDFMDNYMDADSMDSEICEQVRESLDHNTWNEIKDNLNCIDDYGEGWYRRDGTWEFTYVDNDFDEIKEEVRELFEDNDLFEDDEEDDEAEIEPEYYHEEFPEYPLPSKRVQIEEPCKDIGDDMPVQTLFSDCSTKLQKISAKPKEEVFPF